MFCLQLRLTFDSENCLEDNTKFTIVFAKMLFNILLEYFVECTRLDNKMKYINEMILIISALFYNLIRCQATKHMFLYEIF